MADSPALVSTDRADRVADALGEREADVLLVTDLINVRWLTGFTGSNAAAVVGRQGSRRFVTDFRYLTQSAEEVDPAWEREIAVDLLAGVVKGLPASGELRVAFDHLAQHGRWLSWGPVRHGLGRNLSGYVRIPEEECLVELYCDMEQLEPDHEPRAWPDDAHSSNVWGILPPRSYFRFDAEAIAAERGQLEALGTPLT